MKYYPARLRRVKELTGVRIGVSLDITNHTHSLRRRHRRRSERVTASRNCNYILIRALTSFLPDTFQHLAAFFAVNAADLYSFSHSCYETLIGQNRSLGDN